MTPEERETLRVLAQRMEREIVDAETWLGTLPMQSAGLPELRAIRHSLRDLARAIESPIERTCWTCRHWTVMLEADGAVYDVGDCTNRLSIAHQSLTDSDDGCIKGWAPKEGV